MQMKKYQFEAKVFPIVKNILRILKFILFGFLAIIIAPFFIIIIYSWMPILTFFDFISNQSKRIFGKVLEHSLSRYISIFLILSLSVFIFTYIETNYDKLILEGILVELHGTIFDILILGVIIIWLETIREKRKFKKYLMDEVETLKNWQSDEAGFRIAASIRKLSQLNNNSIINLTGAVLRKVDLQNLDLRKFSFEFCDLSGSNLSGSDLEKVNLSRTICINTIFRSSNLSDANFRNSLIKNANFSKAKLRNIILERSIVKDVFIYKAKNIPDLFTNNAYDDIEIRNKILKIVKDKCGGELSFDEQNKEYFILDYLDFEDF